MEESSLRLRHHLIGSVIVALVLGVFQYWQQSIDPVFILTVAVLYFIVRVAIDAVQSQYLDQ